MGIGALQTADYRADYAGYSASENKKVNDFNSGLSYCNALASSLEKWSDSAEKSTSTSESKDDLLAVLQNKIAEIAEKIKNGDTEPTFQIGGQSFTEKEWKKLIEKVDKNIDAVKKEQKERIEKQEAEDEVTEAQIKKLLEDNNER